MLICLCWWTPIRAEKVYVEERGEPVREIENAVLYTFVWTRHYSLCLWKVFLSGGWTVESWEHNVIIIGRHTLKYACNFVFVPLFLNSCNHLSRCHWTMGKGVGLEKITSLPQGRGGGICSRFQVAGMAEGCFWVWHFQFWDFFRLWKFGNSFFGWLDSWWCLHIVAAKHKHLISNLLFVLYNLMLSGKL